MSIHSGFQISDDSSYPADLYGSLNNTRLWLKNEDVGEPNVLFRVLKEMAAGTPYMPIWKTNEFRPRLPKGGEFEHRLPVWEAIAVEVDKANTEGFSPEASYRKKADWLMNQLQLCQRLRRYKAISRNFDEEMEKIGLSVLHGTPKWSEPQVMVTGTFKPRAEAATKIALNIVESLIPVLEEIIKKKK